MRARRQEKKLGGIISWLAWRELRGFLRVEFVFSRATRISGPQENHIAPKKRSENNYIAHRAMYFRVDVNIQVCAHKWEQEYMNIRIFYISRSLCICILLLMIRADIIIAVLFLLSRTSHGALSSAVCKFSARRYVSNSSPYAFGELLKVTLARDRESFNVLWRWKHGNG